MCIRDRDRGYGPGNRNGYSNSEVDTMIEDGRAMMDVSKGMETFITATEMAMNEYALLPLHHEIATWAARDGITYANGALDSTFLHFISKQ